MFHPHLPMDKANTALLNCAFLNELEKLKIVFYICALISRRKICIRKTRLSQARIYIFVQAPDPFPNPFFEF